VESIIAFGLIAGIAFGLIKESCLESETGTHNPTEDEAPAKKAVAKKPAAKKAAAKKPAAKKA